MCNFFPFWPIISMSAFFYISWFKIFIISYGGHLERENNIILIPFFSRVCITYWDLTIFGYLCLFRGFLFTMCLFKGLLFNMCLFRAFCIICTSFRAIDLSTLNRSIILMASFKVPSFSWVLLFWGVPSFEPICLSRFKRILDSFVNCPIGTSIRVGVFAVKICDFVTFFVLMITGSVFRYSHGFYPIPVLARILPFFGIHTGGNLLQEIGRASCRERV